MKKIILGFILGGIVFTLGGVVATTAISSTNVTYQNKTVNSVLDELYNEAITGKELVAAAITNKGIKTTSNDTYETMATNINNIDTDNSELNQKINNLESKHNSDVASLTGSISNLNQSLSNLLVIKEKWNDTDITIPANGTVVYDITYEPINGYKIASTNFECTLDYITFGFHYMDNDKIRTTIKNSYQAQQVLQSGWLLLKQIWIKN